MQIAVVSLLGLGEHCSTTVAAETMPTPADTLGHLLAAVLTHRPS
jgi:hypothetical protein